MRHPSSTVVMHRRKSASPVHNVLSHIPTPGVLEKWPTNVHKNVCVCVCVCESTVGFINNLHETDAGCISH